MNQQPQPQIKKPKRRLRKVFIIIIILIIIIIFSLVVLAKTGFISSLIVTPLSSGQSRSCPEQADDDPSNYGFDPCMELKPVIYLYPEQKQNTMVGLDYNGTLTVSYPEYGNGWQVIAHPDGTIINTKDGKEYSYLFWEGMSADASYDLSAGFIVPGWQTAEFLQDKLSKLGLTPKEYNEFIVYWLPRMKDNNFNLIHFATKEEYDDRAVLSITPKPDSILRVFMVFQSLEDDRMTVEPQELKSFEREGFTVVEWGGTEIK
ncbi:MAG TPA: hypothetical protein PK412_02165 [bacterium]|nr:hypothetical protein [bacterium]